MIVALALLAQVYTPSTRVVLVPINHPVRALAQLHRLWDPSTGRQVAVIPFALAVNFSVQRRRDSVTFRVGLTGAQRTRTSPDSAAARTVVLYTEAARQTGALSHPISDHPERWTVKVSRESPPWKERFEFAVVPLVEGAFAISDLVVGAAGQGTPWPLGRDTVALAPRQIVFTTGSIQVSYQLRSERARSGLQTIFVFTRVIDDADLADRSTTIRFKDASVPKGISLQQRDIAAAQLSGSRYRLDVSIATEDGTLLASRSGMLELVR
ncbi:MAG: hypothetical protein ABJC19_07525 [Gemmatimonadota bacterium]